MSIKDKVIQAALEILEEHSEGADYTNLCNLIGEKLSNVNPANIRYHVYRLPSTHEDKVYKPERGKYCLINEEEREEAEDEPALTSDGERRNESILYQPVADFLRGMDECTSAIPLGGNCFGKKNNTPDVIGIMQPGIGQILDFPIEVISAEVKDTPDDAVIGFGQACAYRLFSHKSYLVVPADSKEMGRVESLCNLFGVGLLVFDRESNDSDSTLRSPKFTVKSRAVRHSPDMFYFKAYLDNYLRKNLDTANKLLRGESDQEEEE